MKLAGYVRVSTNGQAEHGLGLAVQRSQIQKWAKANGHELVEVFDDKGVSGTKHAWERPGLTDALTALEQGHVEGFVVARLDRLARSLTVQEGILAAIWKDGGCVFAVDIGEVLRDDPDDPMRTAMRQMAGVFAELEKAMLVKRLSDGRKLKKAQGGHGGGPVPYGWKSNGWALVKDPDEQRHIALIKRLHSAGWSTVAIAADLNTRGIRTRRGANWYPTTVGRIVGQMPERATKAKRGDWAS